MFAMHATPEVLTSMGNPPSDRNRLDDPAILHIGHVGHTNS
jgi:hypothetical protein